jgi:hypothetical protein
MPHKVLAPGSRRASFRQRLRGMDDITKRILPLETYARDGKLPGWFSQRVGATGHDSQESLSE